MCSCRYYYDAETGWYYLQSRYYDPVIHRFINADSYATTDAADAISCNMFAYCGNNPASRSDPTGLSWLEDIWEEIKEWARDLIHAGNTFARSLGVDTAALGAPFLQMKKDANGIYHADFNCWQQYFGYNDIYDFFFDIGTSMNAKKFQFSYGGEDYMIWIWKGDYINLGAGAEMGIYYGGGPHWLVDTNLACDMSMSLSYQGNEIINYSATHWWITGFNPDYQNVLSGDLSVTYTISFSDPNMLAAFCESSGWISNGSMASYVFR